MHILLIRFSSMGDVLLQTSFASWLKLVYPSCKISYLTSSEFASLIDEHAHIDHVISYQRQKGFFDFLCLRELSKKIKTQVDPDIIFDLHGTTRAKILRFFCSKIPSLCVDKRSLERFLLIKTKVNFLKDSDIHHRRIINDFSFLTNFKVSFSELKKFIAEDTKLAGGALTSTSQAFIKDRERQVKGKYIVVSPIASFAAKRWPIERFTQLVRLFLEETIYHEYCVVILGGPGDDYCSLISEVLPEFSQRLKNLQGQTSLRESINLLSYSELCITNDTGMGHISESFGVPVIALFGPTSESFGFAPHLKFSKSISADVWCRPCSATGSKKCFRKRQYCMEDIEVSEVYNNLKRMIKL